MVGTLNSSGVPRPLLLCLCTALSLLAQQPSRPLSPIGAPDIAEKSTETAILIRQTNANAEEDPRVREIRSDMRQVSNGIDEFSRFVANQGALSGISGQDVELAQTWRAAADRLSQWAEYLHHRSEGLERDRAALGRASDLWSLTMQSAAENDLPVEVQTRLSDLMARLRNAQQATAERRKAVLALQSQLAEERFRTDSIIDQIVSVTRVQQRALLSPETTTIWEDIASWRRNRIEPPSFQLSSKAGDLFRQYLIHLLVLLSLFLLMVTTLWLFLRRLKSRASLWMASENARIRTLAFVVTRPVSTAVFLAVAVEILLLRDTTPFMIGVAVLVLIVPSVRLLPELTGKGLTRAFYLLAILLLALDLMKLVPRVSVAYRSAWLAFQCAILLASVWIWRVLKARATSGSWAYIMRTFTAISVLVAVCAILTNAIGMMRLSLLLAQLDLYSYFAVLTIRGTVLILTGMIVAALRTSRLGTVEFAYHHRAELEQQAVNVLNIAGVGAFIVGVLYLSTLLDPLRSNIYHVLNTRFAVGAISISLENVLAFVITAFSALALSSAIRVALELSAYQHLKLSVGQKETFSKLLHYMVLFLGFLVAFGAAGVELSKIAILAGGLSVGVGLGLQNIVNNFVSGLILLFERPLQVGDLVAVGSVEGEVKNIGIRASTIRNGDGADVIVPNAKLISGELTNWTHIDSVRRVNISIATGLDVQPDRIITVLLDVAKQHVQVLSSPAPVALLSGFNGSSLEFSLGFWCDIKLWGAVSSDIRAQLITAFQQAGIDVPSLPQNLQVKVVEWARAT
jgi:potassium-dependent mechanosensitive channel